MVAPGDTFHFDPNWPGGNPHLWVVLHVYTPELQTEEHAWIVSVTTWTSQGDPACTLSKGDHPFLHHLSYVFYRKALLVTVDSLKAGTPKEAFTPQVLGRILTGVRTSHHIAKRVRNEIP